MLPYLHLNTTAECMGYIPSFPYVRHRTPGLPRIRHTKFRRREVIFDLIEGGIPENEQQFTSDPKAKRLCLR